MRAEKQHSEVRKKQIARAAMALIAEKGMKGLSLAAVSRKVGLVPSALYRHYKGKEKILEAALDLVRNLIIENIRSVRRESPLPLDQLRRLMMLQIQMIQEFQAIPRIIFSEEISDSLPLGRAGIYKIIREILDQISGIVIQGQKLGQINRRLNPETVSVLFLGLFQSPAILWYLSQGSFDVAGHVKRAWPVFGKAIRAETSGVVHPRKGGEK
jgi:TetR/AcrR family transcriptional regulator, fatty acid metabolism regulator protein